MFFPQFLLLLITFFDISNAIRCYQCGSEAVSVDYSDGSAPLSASQAEQQEYIALTLESCSNLEFPFSSWGTYAVDCPPEQVCVKTIVDHGFDEAGHHHYATGSRGCSMRNTSRGEEHYMGCGALKTNVVPPSETRDQWDLVCFCDTDYCNGAEKMGNVHRFLVAGLVLLLIYGNLPYPLLP